MGCLLPHCRARLAWATVGGQGSGLAGLTEPAESARAVEQGDEADKVRAGKRTAALAAYLRCWTDHWR